MTASHLPYTRNGLKFFTRKGGLTSPEVEEICDKAARKYANRLTKVSTMLTTPPKRVDFMSNYAKHLRDIIKERVNHPLHYDTPLQGFQVSQLIIVLFLCIFIVCLFCSFFVCVQAYVNAYACIIWLILEIYRSTCFPITLSQSFGSDDLWGPRKIEIRYVLVKLG